MKIWLIIWTMFFLTCCNISKEESEKHINNLTAHNLDNAIFESIGALISIDSVNDRMMNDPNLKNIIYFNDFINSEYFDSLNLHEIEIHIIEPIKGINQIQDFIKTYYYITINEETCIVGLSYNFLFVDDIRFVISIAFDNKYYFPLDVYYADSDRKNEITTIVNEKISIVSKYNIYQSIHSEESLINEKKKEKLVELLSILKKK